MGASALGLLVGVAEGRRPVRLGAKGVAEVVPEPPAPPPRAEALGDIEAVAKGAVGVAEEQGVEIGETLIMLEGLPPARDAVAQGEGRGVAEPL